jgi:multiple sugar transport system ATP-binding protein
VNVFVASFIGSPAMNLVGSRIEANNGRVFAWLGSQCVPLPPSLLDERPGVRRAVGTDVVLGIRPEAFEDARFFASVPAEHMLEVDVALAESLGSEVIVHFDLEPASNGASTGGVGELDRAAMRARVDPRTDAETGKRLRLALDVERLHFFDPTTQRALA